MGNGHWLIYNHEFCEECEKEVELFEFSHIIKHNGKVMLIQNCSICFDIVDYRFLDQTEKHNIFPN